MLQLALHCQELLRCVLETHETSAFGVELSVQLQFAHELVMLISRFIRLAFAMLLCETRPPIFAIDWVLQLKTMTI